MDPPVTDYDRMSTDELRALAARRGIPSYRIEGMIGRELADYLRDFDLDQEDVARWDPA